MIDACAFFVKITPRAKVVRKKTSGYTEIQGERMANDEALAKAQEEMKGIQTYNAAARSGTKYDGKRFRIPFYNRVFLVHYPELRVEEEGNSDPVPQFLEIILLHYLLQASDTTVGSAWIAYRQLPGSALFERRFIQMAMQPLQRIFGDDIEGFKKAGEAVGGVSIDQVGDAAFKFMALPNIPLAVIFYLGEDEIPSSFNVLFDASAPSYLPTEDLSLLGVYLVGALKKVKPA